MKINFIISAILSLLILLITATDSNFAAKLLSQQQNIGAEGTEKPFYQQTDEKTGNSCYVFTHYVVKTITSKDVGEDIKVFKRDAGIGFKKACINDKRQPYMTIENAGDNWFFGLRGDKFFIDSGTSAGTRGLDVVSLTSKKIIFSTEYNEVVKVSEDSLLYYKPSNVKGLRKNCPQAQKWEKEGGGVGWVRPTRLNLTTLKETSTGKLTCHYIE
jgi:hypothetical protein